MRPLSCVFALWITFSITGIVSGDFDIHTGTGGSVYEFVYNTSQNLLLTIHGQGCYFSRMPYRVGDYVFNNNRDKLQGLIEDAIHSNEQERKQRTTLDEMRTRFGGTQADNKCLSKDIYIVQLDLLSCSFESDLCYWTQVGAVDQMDWLRHSGSTPSNGGGPHNAPTPHQGNKYYLYMEGAAGNPGDTADLQTPLLYIKEPFCLRFMYNMRSEHAEELDIILLKRSNPRETVLWARTGRQESHWLSGSVTIRPIFADSNTPVQILFRAHRGRSVHSDIAIDRIVEHPGTCEQAAIG